MSDPRTTPRESAPEEKSAPPESALEEKSAPRVSAPEEKSAPRESVPEEKSARHENAAPRYTPLRARHEALGASFTDFGGWMMPVRYTSDLAEHHAVRTAAGLFDISHMAEISVTGSDAAHFLDFALAGRISTMAVGKAKYSLILSAEGGIIDDVIAYRLDEDSFVVIANAGNREAAVSALRSASAAFTSPRRPDGNGSSAVVAVVAGVAGTDVRVEDASDAAALIAVQGPRSREILEAVGGIQLTSPARRLDDTNAHADTGTDADTGWTLDELGYYAARSAQFHGEHLLIARTGYTGENGYELAVPNDRAAELWDALLETGAPLGLVPAGLAARDTLRLEAGMPLYGHELSLDTVPAQAGLGRVVALDKDEFVGKSALSAFVATDAPVLVGLVSAGRRAGRAGYAVLRGDDIVGEVTSGALSPTLGHPIAMAFVSPSASSEGTELFIDVRGTRIPATVTTLPFYRRAA